MKRLMKRLFKVIGVLFGLALLGGIVVAALMPWMDRYGASEPELIASYPGDELIVSPAIMYTRAITIAAPPEHIYPWIIQMGAERGGMYSYAWFETNILRCELINADRIHEEWQGLKPGDPVKMCPGNWGPVPYEVASLEPNRSVVLGHQENGNWLDTWQFTLVPQNDGSTRLVVRSRDLKTGALWAMIRPGEFIMEHGMLNGIRQRAEDMQ